MFSKIIHQNFKLISKRPLQTFVVRAELSRQNGYSFLIDTRKFFLHRNYGESTEIKSLDYGNYRKAYGHRKTSEIARALFVFKLCSFHVFVKHSLKMMVSGKKLIGEKLFDKLMKSTFCGQFLGGETISDLQKTAANLQSAGVGPILFLPIEEDVGKSGPVKQYQQNLQSVLNCIKLSTELNNAIPITQLKLTALLPGNLCASLSTAILNTRVEHAYLDAIVQALDGGSINLNGLGWNEQELLFQGLERVKAVGKLVEELGVRLLVDAEYTYFNPALRLIGVAMMIQYNKKRPLVAYTYQNYLKETFDKIQIDETLVRSRGSRFGAKVVRGAYLEKERKMAKEQGYTDPVHACFDDTTKMYYQSMNYLLDKISREPDRYFVIVASHNEDTVQHIVNQMGLKGIPSNGGSIVFGQVYGMCDYLSSILGQSEYLVYKAIPFGSIDECVPYLHRRALENSSLLGATQKDRKMLWRAFLDRLRPFRRHKIP